MQEDWFEYITREVMAEDAFEDLIESAYLAGLIDGETQALAYLWLRANHPGVH